MQRHMLELAPTPIRVRLIPILLATVTLRASGQLSGLAIHGEAPPDASQAGIISAVAAVQKSGKSIRASTAQQQLQRDACRLTLPKPIAVKLPPQEIRQRARASHVRVGWYYQCTHCEDWHLNLAGGYVITSNGAVATAYHVVEPPRTIRDGCLVAIAETDRVFAVQEVLAAERYADACIIRLGGDGFTPLPLNTNVAPGEAVYCLSDPRGRRGIFSQGILNRIFALPERRRVNVPGAPAFSPTRIHVSTAWAAGSSGSAVLDDCGNAIGHVLAVTPGDTGQIVGMSPDAIGMPDTVFHEAASARAVLALIAADNSGPHMHSTPSWWLAR